MVFVSGGSRPSCQGSGLGTELIRFACCLADHAAKGSLFGLLGGKHARAASILRQILIQLVYFRKKNYQICVFSAISAKKGSGKKGSFCPKYLPFGSRLAALAFPLHISSPIPIICAFCNRKASFVSCVRLIIFTSYLPFAFDRDTISPFFIWTDGQ